MVKRSKKKVPLIKKHGSFIVELSKAPPQFRKKMIIDAPKNVIDCISECCKNLLEGHVQLTKAQMCKLHPRHKHIRDLASKSTTLKRKKQILNQKGGFLPLLFLAPLIGKAIAAGVGGTIAAGAGHLIRKI